jgi:hypothetical protein
MIFVIALAFLSKPHVHTRAGSYFGSQGVTGKVRERRKNINLRTREKLGTLSYLLQTFQLEAGLN